MNEGFRMPDTVNTIPHQVTGGRRRLGIAADWTGRECTMTDYDALSQIDFLPQPTGIRPNANPPFPGTFGAYYSDVRLSDQIYHYLTAYWRGRKEGWWA